MSTLYNVLGLPQGASHKQVKIAFPALARRVHPGVAANGAAEQRFKQLSQAYEKVTDPGARADYDRALVCRAAEVRPRQWSFAATAAIAFGLTTGAIALFLWWTQLMRGPQPVRASLSDAAGRGPIVAAQEAKPASGEGRGPTDGPATPAASPKGRGSGWATYHNARFSFALRYPADVFAYDVGSSENVRNFVSRDGAMLHIFAVDNVAGTTLTRYRRSRMEARYPGAVFDKAPVPQRKFGFVLSGTQGSNAFYEHVTFACDGRTIHGWQMIFPVSRRTLYDLVADEVDRTYTPSAQCREPLSSAAAGPEAGTTVRSRIKKKAHRKCWLKHGLYWKCDYHR